MELPFEVRFGGISPKTFVKMFILSSGSRLAWCMISPRIIDSRWSYTTNRRRGSAVSSLIRSVSMISVAVSLPGKFCRVTLRGGPWLLEARLQTCEARRNRWIPPNFSFRSTDCCRSWFFRYAVKHRGTAEFRSGRRPFLLQRSPGRGSAELLSKASNSCTGDYRIRQRTRGGNSRLIDDWNSLGRWRAPQPQ